MSAIKRRQFTQFAGATLASLGLSHLDIQRQSFRYCTVTYYLSLCQINVIEGMKLKLKER